jgi:rod shape determining protein RodA
VKPLMHKLSQFWRETDRLLLFLCIALTCFSCIVLYSCYVAGFIQFSTVWVQAAVLGIGTIMACCLSLMDYQLIVKKLWPFLLAAALVLCLLLLTPLGYTPPGSDDRAWLRLGPLSFQPSEFLKLVFIYTFSLHLSVVKEKINQMSTFLLLCLHGAFYTMLVMFQGDYGSASVFLAIFVVMIFSAGLSWKFILTGLLGVLIALPVVWFLVLPDYLRRRFYVAWNPASDPTGDGYQQYRGQIALGSGKLTGKGLFSDDLISVPEAHNDFIFAYIGQTLGFIGCLITVLMLVMICAKILSVARNTTDQMGCYICCGVFAVICYQSVINIGMVLCLFPVIGITLPFVSGGGTSLLMSFLGIGMVLGVSRKTRKQGLFG